MESDISKASELLPLIYTIFATQILIPAAAKVNKWLSKNKDPLPELLKNISTELDIIKKEVSLSNTSGTLDEYAVIKVYHSALKLLMLRLVSLYTERTRLNHMGTERHRIFQRYERAASELSGKFFVDMEMFTCKENGRKLSGFLNNSGGDLFVRKICDELFTVQEAIYKEDDLHIVSIEDIEASFERYISIISGRVKKWIHNDSLNLDNSWNAIEDGITFFLVPEEIEVL